jgi:hypothetical protein
LTNAKKSEKHAKSLQGQEGQFQDSDGDGLDDYYEFIKLNPTTPDTDNDGKNDGEEDTDGDGLSNLEEQELKTKILGYG